MRIEVKAAAVLILASGLLAAAQTAASSRGAGPPVYDVSTIRPSSPDTTGHESMFSTGSYSGINITLRQLLRTAFDLQDELIAELPPWAEKTKFDVQAKAVSLDEATLRNMSTKQKMEMLRRLLEERFQLKWRFETRKAPVY